MSRPGAAAISASPWLLFLNPDALVEPDTLTRLRDLAARFFDGGFGGRRDGAHHA